MIGPTIMEHSAAGRRDSTLAGVVRLIHFTCRRVRGLSDIIAASGRCFGL